MTDDVLKRLKEKVIPQVKAYGVDTELFDALFARLEAAEQCAEHLLNLHPACEPVRAWRKVTGK